MWRQKTQSGRLHPGGIADRSGDHCNSGRGVISCAHSYAQFPAADRAGRPGEGDFHRGPEPDVRVKAVRKTARAAAGGGGRTEDGRIHGSVGLCGRTGGEAGHLRPLPWGQHLFVDERHRLCARTGEGRRRELCDRVQPADRQSLRRVLLGGEGRGLSERQPIFLPAAFQPVRIPGPAGGCQPEEPDGSLGGLLRRRGRGAGGGDGKPGICGDSAQRGGAAGDHLHGPEAVGPDRLPD